jgi:hypothetical protein
MGQRFSTSSAAVIDESSTRIKASTSSTPATRDSSMMNSWVDEVMSSSSNKSLCDLLHERPTNWEAVRKRADDADFEDVPQDIIAQLFLASNPGPSIADWEWFMLKFGDSAGHFGFGAPRQLVETDFAKRMFLRLIATHIAHIARRKNIFECLKSTKAAKLIIDTFGDSEVVSDDVAYYIFMLAGTNPQPREDSWEFFKTILETYMSKVDEEEDDDDDDDDDESKSGHWTKKGHNYLPCNTALALLEHMYEQKTECQFKLCHFKTCLKYMKQHDSNVLLHQNNSQETILHVVLDRTRTSLPIRADNGADSSISDVRYQIVEFLIKENPELCLIRNCDNALPIHLAMELMEANSDQLVTCLHKAAPQVSQMRCLISGLYPFQLAAENANGSPACDCYHCSMFHQKPHGMSVSSIYTLLRLSPHLITDGYASEASKSSEKRVIDKQLIELAKEELQISRKHLKLKRMRQELDDMAVDINIKKMRLGCNFQDEDDEEDDECEEEDSEAEP